MNKYIDELGQLNARKEHQITQTASSAQQKRWLPPPNGKVKFNVDGAVARSWRGGAAAAICRDQDGLYLGSSAVVFQGITDLAMLETYACREALALAEDLATTNICVASDCQEVINDINREIGGPNAALVHEIMLRCNSFTSYSFIHERRSHNYEANNLAKYACSLGLGRHVWLGNPHDPNLVPMSHVLE